MKDHEERAYTEYVRRTLSLHQRRALLLCGQRHAADDLVQDALTKLYLAWPKVSAKGSADAWVRKVMANRMIDNARSAEHRYHAWNTEVPETADNDHLLADLVVDQQTLRPALMTLPVEERTALVAKYWEGLSNAEMCEALNCSESSVTRYISRGLQHLRVAVVEVAG